MHMNPIQRRSPHNFFVQFAQRVSLLTMLCSVAFAVPAANAGNVLRGATVTDSCIACPADKFGLPGAVTDGDRATMRNLGAGAPGTFTLTTAKPVRVDTVVIVPAMTPAGPVSFEVQTSKDPSGAVGAWVSHGGIMSRPWADKQPVEVAIKAETGDIRAVKVIIHQSPSWVAIYEIEGESGLSIWLYAIAVIVAAALVAGIFFRRRQRTIAR